MAMKASLSGEENNGIKNRRRLLRPLSTCLSAPGQCNLFRKKPLYAPLPHATSTRLLRIHAGIPGEKIRISLETVQLIDTLPSFEALSYVWLQKSGQSNIYCHGHKISVRSNLYDALERLRYPARSRLIWVDSVSINQADPDEVSCQIRQMHEIYKRASRVIIWIGSDDYDEAHPAFAMLCTLVNSQQQMEPSAIYSTIRNHRRHSVECIHGPPPWNSQEWLNVMSFFTNPWFTRLWVLQEVVLARRAIVIWGAAEMDWKLVGTAIKIIRTKFPRLSLRLESRAFQNAYIMNALRDCDLDKPGKERPFLHLLDLSRSFDVTNPKDKIYGLLGFPNGDGGDYLDYALQDYEKSSVADIYTHAARIIMKKEHNLDFLSFTSHTDPDFDKRLTMPSWVPNWNSPDVVYPFMGYGKHNEHKAGKGKTLDRPGPTSPIILRLKGVIIGTISESSSKLPFVELPHSQDTLKDLIQWCMMSTTDDISPLALATTLTASRDKDGVLQSSNKDLKQHLVNFCALVHNLDHTLLTKKWPDDASTLTSTALQRGDVESAREAVWRYSCYRSAFQMENGKLGMGPAALRKGDVVVVFWGGQVPFVLRRGGGGREGYGDEWWRFVGECYVGGVMEGEVIEGLGKVAGEGLMERMFELR